MYTYCDERACPWVPSPVRLSAYVCMLAYLKNHMSKLHGICWTCYLWPWLGYFRRRNTLCRPTSGLPTASCSAFDRTGCAQLCQKVVQCLCFQFLLGNSLLSLRVENPLRLRRFWSKFIWRT